MDSLKRDPALRITLLYLVAGAGWILISDRALEFLLGTPLIVAFTEPANQTTLQTAKGWLFIVVTAGLLFVILRTELRRRARSESLLAESERAHETLISNLPGLVYRCKIDKLWTMEYVSNGSLDLTGYETGDFVDNKKLSYASIIHADDREEVRKQVLDAVNRKEPFQLTYRIIAADGTQKWVWEQGRKVELSVNGEGLERLEGFITDVTGSILERRELERQLRNIKALRTIDLAITSSLDHRLTLEVLLDQVTTQLGIHAANVLLYSHHSHTLRYASGRGFRTSALQHTQLSTGEGLAGRAALERETIIIPDLREQDTSLSQSPLLENEGFVFYAAVPLITKGEIRGVLELFHRSPLEPDQDWLDFMEVLAGQAAIAIDNATLFDELQRSNMELTQAYDQTIAGWARALELRDQETEGHTRRVTDLTMRLARSVGVEEQEMANIRRGALLHDIGKMAIPDSILLKPGPLTEEEWQEMRCHPEYAVSMLRPIRYLEPALTIPRYHHEKWDGSGYPYGLEGENIPLSARIFAIADVWDALRSDRPYRVAWTDERAREYIEEQTGAHFDPELVQTFFDLIEQLEEG